MLCKYRQINMLWDSDRIMLVLARSFWSTFRVIWDKMEVLALRMGGMIYVPSRLA